MAGLFFAQKIARAADIHVVAGDREARAQLIERLQHLQAALRGFGQFAVRRRRQIGVSALLGAADAPAQLIKLRQAEHVGAMHDQRVGGGDVEAAFHDVGGDQHVDLAVVERRHHVFQRGRRHLAVGHRRLYLRHRGLEKLLRLAKIGDARRDIEALPAAIMLAQQAPRGSPADRTASRRCAPPAGRSAAW